MRRFGTLSLVALEASIINNNRGYIGVLIILLLQHFLDSFTQGGHRYLWAVLSVRDEHLKRQSPPLYLFISLKFRA